METIHFRLIDRTQPVMAIVALTADDKAKTIEQMNEFFTNADEGELSAYIADESVLVVDEMPVKISIGIEVFQGKYVRLNPKRLYDFVENAKANIEQIIGRYIAGCSEN